MSLLKLGSNGLEVRKLQLALNRAGATLTVDGDFGRKTEQAVEKFQKTYGLRVDGIVGKETWDTLNMFVKDYDVLRKAALDCLTALEQLPEYKLLEALLNG